MPAPPSQAWRKPRLARPRLSHLPHLVRSHFAQAQHRTAYYLTLNSLMGAAAGFLFWLLLARVGGLDAATVGIGFTVVALGTAVGVVSKGGFDTALLQKIPLSSGAEGRRLLAFSVLLGAGIALALTAGLALADRLGGLFTHVPPIGWALVAAIAVLLVLTWLQDAYFLAIGRARLT
ncbi:MAG: hypothetical protein QOC71_2035, partial [Thermoplasmata archaeon]|nr:hypothetical protein [Thermoplasmata archaeon]